MEGYDVLIVVGAALIGACLGSFLNVVLYRLPRGESLVWPGSHCPHCGHAIRSRDNVPILGWILLGVVRDCRRADLGAIPAGRGGGRLGVCAGSGVLVWLT